MNKLIILCVEDEPDVLNALVDDLGELEDFFPIEPAASADEARELLPAIRKRGDRVGVIFCDHMMTGEKGVDLLIDLQKKEFTRHSRKILVTAHAGMDETVNAVNEAGLNYYISKPWEKEKLVQIAKTQMTEYILEAELDPRPYMQAMDPMLLSEAIRHGLLGDR